MKLVTHALFGTVRYFLVLSNPFNGWFNNHSREKIISIPNKMFIRNFSCFLQKTANNFMSCFPCVPAKLKIRRYKQCLRETDFGNYHRDHLWRANSH